MPLTVNLHAFEVPASESKPSRLRNVAFRLLSLAFSGALLFIALEITLRVTVETTFTAQTDAPLIHSAVPGLHYQLASKYSKAGVRTDAEGLRWRPPDQSPVRYSVLLMGDSIAYGSGVPYEKTFGPVLESRLTKSLGQTTAVWNAAVPGYNTSQESILLEMKGPAIKPNLVLVQFCMNDYLDPPELTAGGTLDATHIDGGSGLSLLGLAYRSRVLVFSKEKVKDLQKARPEWFPTWSHYIHSIPNKPGWRRAEDALTKMNETAGRLDARLLVVVFPVEQQLRIGDRSPQDELVRFARAHGIALLDLYDSFRSRWREGLYIDFWRQALQVDKLHLNERGHALAAEEISARIVMEPNFYASVRKPSRTTAVQ